MKLPAPLAPLQALPHWVVWKYIKKKKGKKPTKVPYQCNGELAEPDNPAT
jgi:putative DNA primase/helicase